MKADKHRLHVTEGRLASLSDTLDLLASDVTRWRDDALDPDAKNALRVIGRKIERALSYVDDAKDKCHSAIS